MPALKIQIETRGVTIGDSLRLTAFHLRRYTRLKSGLTLTLK